MKTAIVHDWLTGMRGGEHLLEEVLPLVPDPTIFTLFHVPGAVSRRIESYPIRASFLDRLPLARRHYRHLVPLYARAVESFDLAGFDLVVSISHCVAKGAISPPGVPHLCYCNTPVRWAWEQFDAYFPRETTRLYALKRHFVERLREWDRRTAVRPTRFLGNSRAVAERIRRHYGREAGVCHPPVDTGFFAPSSSPRGRHLLAVGALVPYKRFELAIEAAALLKRPLVLVGKGPEKARLRALASPSVRIAADLPREELRELYRTCAFFVQPGEEDFGIASVEAIACGAPVVALGRGGVRDIVEDGVEGVLYGDETAEALAAGVRRAETLGFDYTRLRSSATRFSKDRFAREFRRAVDELREPRP
jgi:glycosyltransferase involved in cell wall biosynthesis